LHVPGCEFVYLNLESCYLLLAVYLCDTKSKAMTITKMITEHLYDSTIENGNTIRVDMRDDPEKESLSPMELVLAAVSACVAIDIVTIIKKKRKSVEDLEIQTSGVRKETHPRGYTQIHSKYILTSSDVTVEELYKVAGLALNKYCSVADSLKAEVDYSVEVVNP